MCAFLTQATWQRTLNLVAENNKTLFSHIPGGQKSEIKVLAGLHPFYVWKGRSMLCLFRLPVDVGHPWLGGRLSPCFVFTWLLGVCLLICLSETPPPPACLRRTFALELRAHHDNQDRPITKSLIITAKTLFPVRSHSGSQLAVFWDAILGSATAWMCVCVQPRQDKEGGAEESSPLASTLNTHGLDFLEATQKILDIVHVCNFAKHRLPHVCDKVSALRGNIHLVMQ